MMSNLMLPAIATSGPPLTNVVHHADALALVTALPDNCIDMAMLDLPYGTTACAWDEIIPFAPMWAGLKRVCKRGAAMVFTASQPFTSALVMSNIEAFKYSWVWAKNRATGHVNAHKQPLRRSEDVLVFGSDEYNPQGLMRISKRQKNSVSTGGSTVRGSLTGDSGKGNLRTAGSEYIQEYTNYPDNILNFDCAINTVHGTQKPVALFEYLIRTYTQADDLVLDFVCGSGTTAIAAQNTGRKFICGDQSLEYVTIARHRLATSTLPLPMFEAG